MDVVGYVVVAAAIAVGSFVKGVTGAGLPLIAIPIMATFLGVEPAVVIMALPGVVSNSWLIWEHRGHYRHTRDLPVLLGTGIVGAVLGTWGLESLDPRVLSAVLAALLLTYVTLRLTRPTLRLAPGATRVLSPPVGLAGGVLQGATGISGPLLTTYLHAYRLPAPAFVVEQVTLFQVFAVVQLVVLVAVGLMTGPRVAAGLLALVPMALAMPLGVRLSRRLPAATFDRWVLALVGASALKLLHTAVFG